METLASSAIRWIPRLFFFIALTRTRFTVADHTTYRGRARGKKLRNFFYVYVDGAILHRAFNVESARFESYCPRGVPPHARISYSNVCDADRCPVCSGSRFRRAEHEACECPALFEPLPADE